LTQLEIGYVHIPRLTLPEGRSSGARRRLHLTPARARAFERRALAGYRLRDFRAAVGKPATVVALFCSEQLPEHCHRSLVAHLGRLLGVEPEHLFPDPMKPR
jgi:hypothetical protein